MSVGAAVQIFICRYSNARTQVKYLKIRTAVNQIVRFFLNIMTIHDCLLQGNGISKFHHLDLARNLNKLEKKIDKLITCIGNGFETKQKGELLFYVTNISLKI